LQYQAVTILVLVYLEAAVMKKSANGYSIVELIIVVLFIGIFAAISVPRINFAIITKQSSDTIARKIVTDFRRTRRLAISNAADNANGFSMQMSGTAPYSGYRIINLKNGMVVDTHTINPDVRCIGDQIFNFGPLGNLLAGGNKLVVGTAEKSFDIVIVPATGMVRCVEN